MSKIVTLCNIAEAALLVPYKRQVFSSDMFHFLRKNICVKYIKFYFLKVKVSRLINTVNSYYLYYNRSNNKCSKNYSEVA